MQMKIEQYAPLVVFVYNRPEHTKRLLESINNLKEAPHTKMYVFSDQAKDEKDKEKVDEVRRLLDAFASGESNFCKVEVRKAEKNKGLADSIIEGVTDIIAQYGRVIVLEDDLIVSTDFLRYMNQALDYYKFNSDVWAISGYTFPMKSLRNYNHDVYFSGRGCSWGWGTWIDRWITVDWQVSDYATFKHNWKSRQKFAKWGVDLPEMLDAYMEGEIHSWAIRWCYAAFKQEKVTVYPVKSRVSNCGTDGTGTNYTTSVSKYDTTLNESTADCVFEKCVVNRKIQREFAYKFADKGERFKFSLRWFLIRNGILKAHSHK